MPNTVRQQIMDKIKTRLEGVVGSGRVSVNQASPVDLETIVFPYIFVDSNTEDDADDQVALDEEAYRWSPVIQVWLQDDNPETWLGLIHQAMMTDFTFDGLVTELKRKMADISVEDSTRRLQVLITVWEVVYTHQLGDPYTA